MKKKTLTIAIALVLVVALAVGATYAYLTAKTDEVKNTFAVGKILDNDNNLTLNEHPLSNANATDGKYALNMGADPVTSVTYGAVMPGVDLPKDPTVTIKANALKGDAYLFVVVDDQLANELTFDVNSSWKQIGSSADGKKALLTLVANGGKLTAGNSTDLAWHILANDTVKVADKITSTDLGTLTFNAYLVQAGGFNSAADAWNAAKLVDGLTVTAPTTGE